MTPNIKLAAKAVKDGTHPIATKEAVILSLFKSGHSLNRFEAERFGDHCLHSTISGLRNKGYLFHDVWESVPTRFGREVRVKRYWYIGEVK